MCTLSRRCSGPQCTVRVFSPNVALRMPLAPTPARLKLLHACGQWHSSRKFTLLPVGTVNCVATLKVACPPLLHRTLLPHGHDCIHLQPRHARGQVGGGKRCWRIHWYGAFPSLAAKPPLQPMEPHKEAGTFTARCPRLFESAI
jgi:hypothetical protein